MCGRGQKWVSPILIHMHPLSPTRRTAEPQQAPPLTFATGTYVTDGRRLFRVVSQFSPGAERVFASLEDCMTLEVSAYAPGDLYSMGLRTVEPAA
jgi:hypothetical protein